MFYFNYLNELILRVTVDLVLNKVWLIKKQYKEEISIRYLLKNESSSLKYFVTKL